MLGASDVLRENLRLRRLLLHYEETYRRQVDAEWLDRLMELDGTDGEELSRLHGLLLAHGWLDSRVHHQAFDLPGQVRACYQITREGRHMLRFLEDVIGVETELVE